MEKHDHPTASQRLGDTEAGLGAAATLTSSDADAIRKIKGVQYVSEGIHTNVHVTAGSKRWFTRLHGDDVSAPVIRRAWMFEHGRFFSKREESNGAQVIVLGAVASQRLFGAQNPVGKTVNLWKQSFEVVGVVGSGSWLVAPAPGDDQFDAVYVPFTTIQHLLTDLSKLNDITTHHGLKRRCDARGETDHRRPPRGGTRSPSRARTISLSPVRPPAGAGERAGCCRRYGAVRGGKCRRDWRRQ